MTSKRLAALLVLALAALPSTVLAKEARAVFAMGCFWSAEHAMENIPGVIRVTSGFTGGTVEKPTYEQVTAGGTGHYEAAEVIYDPERVSYRNLLTYFWRNIDPFDPAGQFCDKGDSYRAAIFVSSEKELRDAQESKLAVEKMFPDKKIMTEIIDFAAFYAAEDYHQDYARLNAFKYKRYRWGCGRDKRLDEIWKK